MIKIDTALIQWPDKKEDLTKYYEKCIRSKRDAVRKKQKQTVL